jgi:glycosyltransferase involved in cell wall biosynthesis
MVVVPETFDDPAPSGSYTPCAQIRLLRPLDHPAAGHGLAATTADTNTASWYHADIIVTQRHAVPSIAAADAIAAHAKRTGAALIYDLDDDLLTVPPEHPEAAELAPKAAVVEHMIRRADIVRTSTAALAARVAPLAREVQVVGNALDERIWLPGRRDQADRYGPVRILCMGTATHDADFAILLPALEEIHRQFGDQITFDVIGFVSETNVPAWIRRAAPSPHAARSYAGFVHWLTWSGPWDIGLAPLADSPFNICKSPIKILDYAALGLATLASDVPPYQGSLADGPGGILVPNTTADWHEGLSRLIRDTALRRHLASHGSELFKTSGTLASQADAWQRAWPRTGKRKRRAVS